MSFSNIYNQHALASRATKEPSVSVRAIYKDLAQSSGAYTK